MKENSEEFKAIIHQRLLDASQWLIDHADEIETTNVFCTEINISFDLLDGVLEKDPVKISVEKTFNDSAQFKREGIVE